MMSKIAAGVASANQALLNSNAGFKLEAAAIMHVDYDDTNHAQSLSVRWACRTVMLMLLTLEVVHVTCWLCILLLCVKLQHAA
jgi:hypothetical protein